MSFVISPSAIWVQTRHTMIFLGDNGKGASFGTWISNADPIHPEFSIVFQVLDAETFF